MIRTFVDALPQSIEQSIMRNEKNKTIFASLAALITSLPSLPYSS